MDKKEELKIKSAKLTNELNKYQNDIKDIFSNYGFEVNSNELKPFISTTLQYESIIYSPTESIINDIDLLNFLLNNEDGCKLVSLKNKDYYTINIFQRIKLIDSIQKKISKEISDFLNYASSRTNINLSILKTSQLNMSEWYKLLKEMDRKIEKDKEIQIIEYILRFSTTKGFITSKINKKGTKAISNSNLAFIYDLLYYIQNKNRDSTLNQKEKSDHIRYRLRKISWEKIMGKNQNISQETNP